jgi:hypothetical protein
MRTVVLAAVVGACVFARPVAAAQDPEPAAPREQAVPRAERPAARERHARAADSGERAARPVDRGGRRNPDASVDAADSRGPGAPRTAPEPRLDPAPTPAAANTAVADDDQRSGGERRGAVRRPPSGGSTTGDSPRGGSIIVDRAVPRSSAPRPTHRVYVFPHYYRNSYYRYYDPWGYGAFGLGYFYYSPWGWNPGYYSYGPSGYYGSHGFDVGSVKLKVKPRDAEVFVDGYFAGQVDDFDGMLQSLKLDSGAHTIEVRKPGFETLRFDVMVQPERAITFRSEMKPVP